MCRWLTYKGDPIFLEDLIYKPDHSLIDQSLRAMEAKVPTNGDGFGIGWYGDRDLPGLYREVLPAWNDSNLRSLAHQISSPLFFAHVRASTGTETVRSNCHPFAHQKWLFMHNGQIGNYMGFRRRLEAHIPDTLYAFRQGTTDSEILFYLLLAHDLDKDPLCAINKTLSLVRHVMEESEAPSLFRCTAALSDGKSLYAIRYSSDDKPPSLYYAAEGDRIVVVSEPLDDVADNWEPVPAGHLLQVHEAKAPVVMPLDS
ncbi:MAG: class II glutamine amidotransferase [Pseudomonadota bacterium]